MVERPALDEFLSALNGFLEQKNDLPPDPSHLRFLEIFCRSVGSAEGHLLRYVDGKGLETVVSCGLSEKFVERFHETSLEPAREPSPLDSAFRDQQVMAVVDFKRGSGAPMWFMDVMAAHKFKALVAVPLIGQQRAVGVLCAYYRDICLFDQGTLDRLMTIGRMVGTAMEKSIAAGADVIDRSDPVIDAYLKILTTQPIKKAHVFEALAKVLAKTLAPSGIIAGPLRFSGSELSLTVAEAAGIPPTMVGPSFAVPPFLAQRLLLGQANKLSGGIPFEEWGALRPMLTSKAVAAVCQPVVWQKQPVAAVIAWRSEKKPFTESDEALLARLSSITALALHAV